jgi:hypothetical protein
MVVGPAKVLFMDSISTGLDSSTTYLIVNCLRNFCQLLDQTIMISLLQPPPGKLRDRPGPGAPSIKDVMKSMVLSRTMFQGLN